MDKRIIQVPFEIDQDWVDGVVCTALEGGINYWCVSADLKEKVEGIEFLSEAISKGGTIILELDEPFDDNNTEFYELTLDSLVEGYSKYIQWASGKGRTFYTDPADIDAGEADIIVQFALFSEIIFG